MMNQAPHVMDLFIQLGGMPCAVYGRTETRMHRIEVEDLAEALLRYPNGGTGYLACSTNEFGPGQMIELFGDRGKLVYRDGALRLFRFKPAIRTCITRARGPWEKPSLHEVPLKIDGQAPGQAAVLRNLVRHLLRGEPLVTEAQTAWASLELANAITLSAHEDRWVTLPIRRAAYDRLLAERRRTSSFVKPGRRDQRVTDPRLAP